MEAEARPAEPAPAPSVEAPPPATEPAAPAAAEPHATPPAPQAAAEPPAQPEAAGFRPATPTVWRRWFPEPVSTPASPFWWGWSWGWGYYPVYPGPDMKRPPGVEFPEPNPDRVVTTLRLTAGATENDGAIGTGITVDGARLGFGASVDAIGKDADEGVNPTDGQQALGWTTAHVSWSFVSERSARVRVEVGGSMLSLPDTGAYAGQPYGGSIVVGPSVGVSGHFGVVGPLGVEGHVRVSPSPVLVEDSRLALAFRAGSFAFTAGERRIRVSGDGKDAPKTGFSGSEVGVAFRF